MMAFRQFECIYADMSRFDLAAALEHVQAFGRRETACLRLDVHKTSEPAALTK